MGGMEVPCTCDSDYDFDWPSFFQESYVVARKPHICCECSQPIQKGQKHQVVKGVWDGRFEQFRTCLGCARMRDDWCNPPFGMLREAIYEKLDFDYVTLESSCDDCGEPTVNDSVCDECARQS